MPAVQPIGSTLPSDPEAATGLSPDALMSYCDTRLSSLDSQMQQIFAQQTQSAATLQNIDAISTLLNSLPQPTGTASPPTITMSDPQLRQLYSAYDTAIDDLSTTQGTPNQMYGNAITTSTLGNELGTDVGSLTNNISGSVSAGWTIPESAITNLTNNLKTYSSNLSSDSEMQMINLQSLMSSRQTAVELSTNLMQSMASTDQGIAANFKDG